MVSLSHWERESFLHNIDILILGSGIVGLSAAISLKTQSPKLNVMVLERGSLPAGASTKNAGFACFGSMTELIEDLGNRSESEVFNLVKRRWDGLKFLRNLIGDSTLRYQAMGGYEIFGQQDHLDYEACLNHLDSFNFILKSFTGWDATFVKADEKIKSFGFQNIKHIIFNQAEGQLHPGEMVKSMINLAQGLGVKFINGTTVTTFEDDGAKVKVFLANEIVLESRKLLLATNGFTHQLVHDIDLEPARNQVLITEPIVNLPFAGTFHYNRGYYYFRNVEPITGSAGSRILLGGGRNLTPEVEATSEFGHTEVIRQALEKLLREVIFPSHPVKIESWWSGILGIGSGKEPIVKMVSPSVGVAARLGGMGVAIGSLTGKEAAELLLSSY